MTFTLEDCQKIAEACVKKQGGEWEKIPTPTQAQITGAVAALIDVLQEMGYRIVPPLYFVKGG